MEKKNTQQQDITTILKRIKEILKSDAKLEFKENDVKVTVIDDRFHNIRQLIQQIVRQIEGENNNKNKNKKYRRIIELISNYIEQIYDKKDFDTEYANLDALLNEANRKFTIRLLKYISSTLKTNPNINSNIRVLKDHKDLSDILKNGDRLNLDNLIDINTGKQKSIGSIKK